jgi:hypothetical protein
MRNLADVLRDDYALGESLAGWTLTAAFDISDDGRTIVGQGVAPGGTTIRGWMAHLGSPLGPTWNVDANGNWFSATNWTNGIPTDGDLAVFAGATTAPRSVTVDAPIAVGRVFFDNTNAYTIAGSKVLTFDTANDVAEINVVNGSHTISAPVTLVDKTLITVTPSTSTLSITKPLNADGITLFKYGAGTLTLNNLRAGSLSIDAGTVALVADTVEPNASVLDTLSIAGDGKPRARLDLGISAIVINGSAKTPTGVIREQIVAGRGGSGFGASWTGNGIASSAAAAANTTEPESRSIGYAENGSLPLGPYTTFRGQPVDDTSMLIAFTRTGDANLDGVVNDQDVTIVSAAYAPGVPQPHWALGDFDYDGFVDDGDVTLLGVFYDPSAAPLMSALTEVTSTSGISVPEPSTGALLGVLAGVLIGVLWVTSRAFLRQNTVATGKV